MASLSFIHAADLHLGSAPQVNQAELPADTAKRLNQANYTAFKRIVDTAVNQNVDFLLLAGDIYDREERSIAANRFFNNQCRRLAEVGIPVYVIAGNHDPLGERKQLFSQPDNVVEFSSQEPENYRLPAGEQEIPVRIYGQSYAAKYESQKLYTHFQPSDTPNSFNIGLLHTQLKKNDIKYIPATQQDLKQQDNIDYWALGHIHQCRIENKTEPPIIYPGIPQGRDFGESGVGGCLLVEVEPPQKIKTEFILTSPFVFLRPTIRIDKGEKQPANIEELIELIREQAEEMAASNPQLPTGLTPYAEDWPAKIDGYIVDWIIKGRGKLHQVLKKQPIEAEEEIITRLRQAPTAPYIWSEGIKFNTKGQLPELAELKAKDNAVFSEIADLINLCRTDEEWEASLKEELGNIWNQMVDHENVNPEKFQLTEEIYQEIIEQAENLIIERIMGRREE